MIDYSYNIKKKFTSNKLNSKFIKEYSKFINLKK